VKPFLRPTDRARLAPVGWSAEPAGIWGGKEVEVVFDPRRHQVLLARNDLGDKTRSEIAGDGFRRIASDGKQEMWVRDQVEVMRGRLDRLEGRASQQRSTGIEAPGL